MCPHSKSDIQDTVLEKTDEMNEFWSLLVVWAQLEHYDYQSPYCSYHSWVKVSVFLIKYCYTTRCIIYVHKEISTLPWGKKKNICILGNKLDHEV